MNLPQMRRKKLCQAVAVFVLAGMTGGCVLRQPSASTAVVPATPVTLPQPVTVEPQEASDVMVGVCFEAAYEERGRVFVLTSAIDHINFYDRIDAGRLCRWPIKRYPFDFTQGRALVGTWSYGTGCTARHTLGTLLSDESTRTLRLAAQFATDGTCNYELLRPLWLSVALAEGWTMALTVER